jgi:hypothetical protein
MNQETHPSHDTLSTEEPNDPSSSHLKKIVKGLGLTLLGAAAALPVICLYLTKRILRQSRRPMTSKRTSSPSDYPTDTSKPVRIPITLPSEQTTEETPQEEVSPEQTEIDDATASPDEDHPKYIASTESDKFHHPQCRWARQIRESHRIDLTHREKAVALGLKPCRTCNP